MNRPNPALYRTLSEPFDDVEESEAAFNKFFEGVQQLREACGIPDVHIIAEATVGPEERRMVTSLHLGSFANKLPMLARALGSARQEHENMIGAVTMEGRRQERDQ